MTQAPMQLFDRRALNARRSRRRPDALFLHQMARDEAEDRLGLVNRTFTAPAVVCPFPEVWEGFHPQAKVVADEDVLDLKEGTHDVVIHAMCLHWSNDPVGQLIQCRRALKEDGLLLVILLGGQTLHELRVAMAEAETVVLGGLSPRIAPMGEIRDLGGLLQRAGFALPVADLVPLTAEYRDLTHLVHDLRGMGETNTLAQRLKRTPPRGLFHLADHIYREHFANAEGRLPATFELVCLTGWSPSDNQQKPLRPGSAQMRLADALKVPESKL
ncbi:MULTISPECIES: methyltransferase domain-containing protein [unclassified Leisingera]|uniref:methyltransferase domain-containing protein n=1 Tax=unclassified Leisingera TaxID=2614906 RepID=UPI00038101A7|nr:MULTISPECIES: methyltransferase domain-containing protein [unclassified Leisingera]KIC18255.1 SAM-dependent methyltransferase [Leisingera sp. ANG-DT]KIC24317.1 SAM-dependent methyltransferase [Leisingera sp. ANG-S3]KIC32926.1 SAM-dependent methyltransferase [Leisingera sp. ANG-S5]KIC53033.1 SAM-dependent methyltransferase [Leisingera sp. ANG-S]KID10067.1 SAM-dependent methyltransferase [Leisingera sp. ANG1]